MLNKKLVLGSLAGATLLVGAAVLLPSAASAAGLMSGACASCHTMHNSQEGGTMADGTAVGDTAYAQLLRYDGCIGCHAIAAQSNTGTGVPTDAPYAPQVDNTTAATMLAGGYFAAVDANMHSVDSFGGAANLTSPPGDQTGFGTFTESGASANADFTCQDCHAGAKGGHHLPAALNTYRFLGADADNDDATAAINVAIPGGTPLANYGVNGGTNTDAYDSASMNMFCQTCHQDFHADAGVTSAAGAWVRHPTDVGFNATYNTANSNFTGSAVVPMGDSAAVEVMCISCHRAHGNANADMLRFTYDATGNVAGNSVQSTGCESCHGIK